MKKIFYYFTILMAVSLVFSSCQNCVDGHGPIVSEVRDLDDFSKLEINIPADVLVHIGEFPKVSIRTHDDIMGVIKTTVKGKTLIIDSDPCIGSVDQMQIDLVVTNLNSISINGSAALKLAKEIQLKADDLDLEVSGSGRLIVDVLANSLDAEINGSGNIDVRGTAKKLNVGINGSGSFSGFDLQAFEAKVEINGSGNANVNSKNLLDIEINGSGELEYIGNPKFKSDITGSGEVKKVDG